MRQAHLLTRVLLTAALCVAGPTAARATTFSVVNLDGAGEGFNDPTPRSPEGGNPGTTLGALRQNAFQEAANRWAAIVNSPVTILADGNFDPLFCSPGSVLLGQAGPNTVHRDFPGAPVASTWFAQAQANSLAGTDLAPGTSDIGATFNSSLDAGCFSGAPGGWYYGFDGNPSPGKLDFVPTLLHELAHGLGFLSLVDLSTGAKFLGFDDTYMRFLENHSTGLMYPAMSDGQRLSASINTGNLHWVGANVAAASALLSAGKVGTHVQVYAPNPQEPGSSVSHFDVTLNPNELMEPFDTGTSFQEITEAAFLDMDWALLPQATATPTATSTAATPTPTPTATPVCPEVDLGSTVPLSQMGSTVGTANVFAGSCQGGVSPERTFKYTAPMSGTYTIDVVDGATSYDTVLYVRDGACGGAELACNDDFVGLQSRVTVALTMGQEITIFVDGYGGASGTFVLHITTSAATPHPTCTPPPAPGPTATPVTAGAGKCKRAIAKSATKFYAAKTKILQKCEENLVKTGSGTCPNGTATTKIATAAGKLASAIGKACGGDDHTCGGDLTDEEPPAGLGWPATCPNFEGNADPACSAAITDCGDIAACITCVGEAAVDQAIALYYDALLPSGSGTPLNKCQQAIGKASAKFVTTKDKAIQKCWDARIAGKHAGTCPDALMPAGTAPQKAAVAIAIAEAKTMYAICKACGGSDQRCDDTIVALDGTIILGSGGGDDLSPAAIGFLPACPAVKVPGGGPFCDQPVATLADLVECVDCVSEFKVDCMDRNRVPEFGTYPCECNP